MIYIEQTGTDASGEKVYAMQELKTTDLLMLKVALGFLKSEITSSESRERHQLLPQLERLRNTFDTIK